MSGIHFVCARAREHSKQMFQGINGYGNDDACFFCIDISSLLFISIAIQMLRWRSLFNKIIEKVQSVVTAINIDRVGYASASQK